MIDVLGGVFLILAVLPLSLAIINILALRLTPNCHVAEDTFVSILIPARNEASQIADAVHAALASTDVTVEVLVMDDGSVDGTAEIVRAIADRNDRVRVLSAPPLPPGWTGKVHACHELAQSARGTHLLFVDADVRLQPHAAAAMAAHVQASGAKLVSAVPRQIMKSLGELLTVPTVNFVLLGYLPIPIMRMSPQESLGAACGQVLLVDREAYHAAGGHRAIRHLLHDGIQLARQFRRTGFATDLLPGERLATCRMYHNMKDAWSGFAKNAHEGMATPVSLPVWTVLLAGGHILPFLILPFLFEPLILAAAAASLLARSAVAVATRETLLTIPLHPFTMAVGLSIQWSVLLRIGKARKAGWKGRLYPVELRR
jgi:GT2 family glycosyltransferase